MREDGGSYPELLKSEGPRSNQVLISRSNVATGDESRPGFIGKKEGAESE